MKNIFPQSILLVFLLLFSQASFASVAVGKAAPNFTLKDHEGNSHQLSDYLGKYVVLEWFNPGCPYVKKHYGTKNMQKFQKQYTEKGVVWLQINSSAQGKQGYLEPKELAEYRSKNDVAATTSLRDPDGTVGKLYGAKTTPHMFVINPEGNIIYMGAIDDQASYEIETVPIAKNYIGETLDAALAGKPIAQSATQPYGCSVKY